MMKKLVALLAITSLSFSVSCSNDASVSALGSDAITEIVLDDTGNVIDEEPIEENEDIEDIVEEGEEEEEESEEVVIDIPIDEEEEIDIPVDPPACMMRKGLRVEKLDGSGAIGDISSYKGYLSAAMNYNYYSASAHPIVGPHPEEYEGHFFFYEGKEGLALNFFYNIDAGGSSNNQVKMEIIVKGNDQIDRVLLSDDGHEVKKFSDQDGANRYAGKLHYWYNTDGGVIGPLKGEDFKIHVKVYNIGDNKTVGFHSADGKTLALKTGTTSAEAYSEFVIYYAGDIKDCDSDKIDDSRNQCIKKIADDYEEDIKSSESWREKYRSALDERKSKVKGLASEHRAEKKAIKDEFKEILARLRASHKSANKDLRASHHKEIKSCNKDKEARKSGDCKAKAQRLRAERKSLHLDQRKAYKAILDQRKAALHEYCKGAKAKRKSLAHDLLKKAKALKKELRGAHSEVMKSFQKDIESCSAE